MDVMFTSLEALILKATLDFLPTPDGAALDAFCVVMKDSPDGPALAAKALAARVHSGNARESLLALVALDHCMQHCNSMFRAEVGKFRFLNELIKLVSPKYYADRTPPEVQQRVLQLLHAWSIAYPKETKFKVAFDMLRSQGVVRETPPPLPSEHGTPEPPQPRPRAATFHDDEKSKLLQKLLQSKNPDDLQYANKLIKTMVREEERRTEAAGRRTLEVRRAVESARLLDSLLNGAGSAGDEERQLMRELEAACRRHHAAITHLASTTRSDDADILDEVLKVADELTEVFAKFQAVMAQQSPVDFLQDPKVTNGADSLLDLAGLSLGKTVQINQVALGTGSRDLDTLGDIFATENGPTSTTEPLKPFSLVTSDLDVSSSSREAALGARAGVGAGEGGMAALDSLGADLLQQSLPGCRVESFAGKSTKKIPMNSIERSETPQLKSDTLDLDYLVYKSKAAVRRDPSPPRSPSRALDDLILDISMEASQTSDTPFTNDATSSQKVQDHDPSLYENTIKEHKVSNPSTNEVATILKYNNTNESKEIVYNKQELVVEKAENKKVELRGLSDVEISLASVQASSVPPLTLLEEPEGLTIVLHLATNRPRLDVFVLVLSTTSKHKSPVSDYKLHAVVPKCCKVRLLPATGTCLPPHAAFLQPAAIIQMMLIERPASVPSTRVSLKFVVTYCCDDDTVTEMGEIIALPLDQL